MSAGTGFGGTWPDGTRVDGWRPVVEIRRFGLSAWEARTEGGLFSAVGLTRKTAIDLLRAQLPRHEQPFEKDIPIPPTTDE